MKDTDIKRLLYVHLLCIFSIILSIFIPSFFLENFSVLETHLTWLCICSVSVTAVNLVSYLVVKPNASSKRSSLSYKVTRFLKCCIYFLMSCFSFHVIFVLYGAPLTELALETFLLAVTLSTFTTVPCLCLLGPNFKAWLRVFSRNGVTSIWENSLQITTVSSFVGTWLGAFPIPLDWGRPWQVLVAARQLLSCGMQTLSCGMHVGPSSLTRDRTQAPCIGSAESYLLRHQGSPSSFLFSVNS
ncbi:phosphatidylinositol-glycan biosynthesis class F protein isoform X1 [Physeter macrocephalus]|uniref:Phosphatidylinositol-glycan biosynthesis class F protein isoform X1 n=1 Tax=Physeter macrocephalus TaxID=9755 RepID=A0A9W2X191_PHYMC|nr:phosphatidylinositol-glycan biosynthesis class F protein isoform X1 [Physeter catodon]XP_054945141.1 phosphatidylinositol-glycan biosynthesis class F protein isoform X1 [Physeter catodon]XP_054945142.1 phosphatidylinositol-glycan biosynthesis class F protein isoform X1 [Physeter catodon]